MPKNFARAKALPFLDKALIVPARDTGIPVPISREVISLCTGLGLRDNLEPAPYVLSTCSAVPVGPALYLLEDRVRSRSRVDGLVVIN
jgi:hypothetical protein